MSAAGTAARSSALAEIVSRAEQEGIGAFELAFALRRAEANTFLDRNREEVRRRWSRVPTLSLAYLGAMLIYGGVALRLGVGWADLSGLSRTLLTLGTGFVTFAFAVPAFRSPAFRHTALPMLTIGLLVQPGGMVVGFSEMAIGWSADVVLLVTAFTLFIQVLTATLKLRETGLVFFLLIFAGLTFAAGWDNLMPLFSHVTPFSDRTLRCWESIILGSCYLGAAEWLLKSRHRRIAPFFYLLGGVLLVSGAYGLVYDWGVFSLIFLPLIVGTAWLGYRRGLRSLIFVAGYAALSFAWGSLARTMYNPTLTDEATLMLAGLLYMGFGFVLVRARFPGMAPFFHFVGGIMAMIGAFRLVAPLGDGSVIYLGLTVLMLYLAVLTASRTLLAVSAVATLFYVGWFSKMNFDLSMGWTLALIVMGMIMTGLSGLTWRLAPAAVADAAESPPLSPAATPRSP
jgi:hypothetical protein